MSLFGSDWVHPWARPSRRAQVVRLSAPLPAPEPAPERPMRCARCEVGWKGRPGDQCWNCGIPVTGD